MTYLHVVAPLFIVAVAFFVGLEIGRDMKERG